jgi:D-alanyl-D-alanine carboxypeptidase/D-alanyl-D-alanine-endopeptidase (penicillin-binding protein 4)
MRRSGRRPMGPRRKRGLARLLVFAIIVALIAGASLLAERRLDAAPAGPAGATRRAAVLPGSSARSTSRPTPSAAPPRRSAATSGTAAADPALQKRITAILSGDGFAGGSTAVYVYDLSAAHVLYAHHARTRLLPASNEKLITSSTALAKWGGAYRFTTDLFTSTSGTIDTKGVYRGLIYLKGYGDPSLSTAAYQGHVLHLKTSRLSDFVGALTSEGVKSIRGRIVGDDSYFDAARSVAVWNPEMSEQCGPLSALSLNEGVELDGGRVSNPPLFAAASLTAMLRHSGIPVSGAARVGVTPSTARLACVERSAPLSAIIAVMNKSSDNFFAEMLTKGLGASFGAAGSTTAGIGVERAFLVSQGISSQTFAITDGSGLSYVDRETPLDITKLLRDMALRGDWPVFWGSLSVAGVDGTLADRMRGTAAQRDVHGKTGSLDVASSLSGYVRSANGMWLAFSVLMNKSAINVITAHAAQDTIAVALARSQPGGAVTWIPNPAPSAIPSVRPAAGA